MDRGPCRASRPSAAPRTVRARGQEQGRSHRQPARGCPVRPEPLHASPENLSRGKPGRTHSCLVFRNGRSNVRLCRCGATPLTASPMTPRVQSCSHHQRLRVGRSAVAEGAAAELLTPVGGEPVRQIRPLRDNTRRVDVLMHDVVVLLDLAEVDRVAEPRGLEQVTRIRPQHRHLAQLAPVALEAVSYTHLKAHETRHDLVCRLLLEKKKKKNKIKKENKK